MRNFAAHHPIPVCLHLLLTVSVAMVSFQPMLLLLSCLGGFAYVRLLTHDGTDIQGKWGMGMAVWLFVCAVLLNLLTNRRGQTVLLVWNDHPMTLEALRFGVVAGMMLVAALLWFRALTMVLTSDRLLYLLRPISPKLALLFSMTIRTVPLLRRQRRRVLAAQQTLCTTRKQNDADSLPDRIADGVRVGSVLLTWSLENGMQTADSMAARGYGIGRRTACARYRFTAADAGLLALTLLCTAVLCVGAYEQVLTTTFFPVYQPPVLTSRSILCLAAYACMTACPFVIDAKERVKWRLYQSRI